MPHSFAKYTESLVHALEFNPKNQEVIERKQEIVKSIIEHHGNSPDSILFYGFSPLMLASTCKNISVTSITPDIKSFLDKQSIKYTYIADDDLGQYYKQFSWVVAGDEYYTFAKTEQDQLDKIKVTANLAKDLIVTTLRDYKNQDFRDREFSQPLAVHAHNDVKIFLEHHRYDFADKNSWNTTVYELDGVNSETYGMFARRSMFFKQMAKFSIDAGAKNFFVHKNLMYKSLIKKNYEHVISISF
jgi:hypothetical protein